ncbi:hypothetical protein D3C74_485330 [compost metagenome]
MLLRRLGCKISGRHLLGYRGQLPDRADNPFGNNQAEHKAEQDDKQPHPYRVQHNRDNDIV